MWTTWEFTGSSSEGRSKDDALNGIKIDGLAAFQEVQLLDASVVTIPWDLRTPTYLNIRI